MWSIGSNLYNRGLMKNKSDVQPDTIHGDTQAESVPVFGLTYLCEELETGRI